MFNNLPLEHYQTGSVFMVAKLMKKDRQNLILIPHGLEPCTLVPIWLKIGPNMAKISSLRALPLWTALNLTIMTYDREPCQLVPIWLMTSFRALSHWKRDYGSHI